MNEILFGDESWQFLPQVAVRTLVMFAVISIGFRLIGKRGIKQLSVYELGVIVGLGSAAGDPMFYKEVGLLLGIIVVIVVVGAYLLMERAMEKSERISVALEGQPVPIVREGRIVVDAFEHERVSRQELFAQLRLNKVSQLAQVRQAIIEPTGEISVFFRRDEDVGAGLPILPDLYDRGTRDVTDAGTYACTYCGAIEDLDGPSACSECRRDEWVPAVDDTRVV